MISVIDKNCFFDFNESMQIIHQHKYQIMPWKNGQGSTAQIDVAINGWWRLSAATVNTSSSFSNFNGYDRLLCIWIGQGLLLNDHLLQSDEVYRFCGEDQILCQNVGEVVVDLGFIFQREFVTASMSITSYMQSAHIETVAYVTYMFCLQGEFMANQNLIHTGDTIKLEAKELLNLQLKSASVKLAVIEVYLI